MLITRYSRHTGKLSKPMDLAVVSDLHNHAFDTLLPLLDGADCLLVPGDSVSRYRQIWRKGLAFMETAAKRMPVYFSLGNHEYALRRLGEYLTSLTNVGVHVLDNRFLRYNDVTICGWYRPELFDKRDVLPYFIKQDGCKILLCHRPEDYIKRIQGADIDLVLAGHAHGGQIRVFGRGLYAPGQGLFPAYTKGDVDGRLIICAGASNDVPVPRFGNPTEILRIALD